MRWNMEYLGNVGARPAASALHFGGFMQGVELHDNVRFGISSSEAASMDPQQRLILERGYEALHSASFHRHALDGELIGVFLGVAANM